MEELSPDCELEDLCSNPQSTTHKLSLGRISAWASFISLFCMVKIAVPVLYIYMVLL